ncbi:exopolyphosphatase [Plasmodium vivax India VII]|uniref:Exopolyphosphatase, putative n=5 Tax=Plasmodium vivax TaxID=5855 RepID=A5K1K4_PLAVS|nr:exopolyphosphatase, putative [Plasmodium vivax]KMZ78179.1 exopolyphosphatase [Plasmodium vivax India VII]KMZ84949.1 exopolyphosphatase [Plasmodium vivax Brazil I]KMZ90573.1 exopolyphosphatase [Plasmodium vivax Mauritania I]KMZ97261.1 exopolyphosphatase [Plasmodium vivax North Korean]EDL47201.1 exopolyphosphatase, putative [Plasmodium vivax]|eukprot:XP_001616928.1 exopolyphosphatase [Plasmodium vivax Sal-1]
MIRNNELNCKHFDLFSYEDPELCEEEDLFESNQAPWFYHLTHLLELRKDDFKNIKSIVENEKKRGIEYSHILDIIDYQTYSDIMRKINSNMRNALSVYLFSCKYFLSKYSKNTESNGHVHFVFVFGNITADLDSVCSSIIYSFFLHIWYSLKSKTAKEKNSDVLKFFIPVINIKRSDMKLKILINWWLEKCEINNPEEILVFNDDKNLLEVLKNDHKYDICFVDFNDFEPNNMYNINNVKSIIDHHMLKEEAKNKRITKSIYPIYVCSCMVIIAYLYKHSSEFLGIPFINKNMMWLIYGTILRGYLKKNAKCDLVYSNNFAKGDFGKRWIQPDLSIFLSLKRFFRISNKMDIYITYSFNIMRFSINLKKFGIENLLFADYKDYNYELLKKKIKMRIASIDFSIDLLFSNEDVNRLVYKLHELCAENNFSIFILIGSYLNNYRLFKDMGIFFYNNDVNKDDLINALFLNKDIKLSKKGCKNITWGNDSKIFDTFQINNQCYSRKRLEYFLSEYFFSHG